MHVFTIYSNMSTDNDLILQKQLKSFSLVYHYIVLQL